MTQRWLDDPEMRAAVLAGRLLGRGARPEEMTGMVLYLCSPLASFATGQTFIVDGGQTHFEMSPAFGGPAKEQRI